MQFEYTQIEHKHLQVIQGKYRRNQITYLVNLKSYIMKIYTLFQSNVLCVFIFYFCVSRASESSSISEGAIKECNDGKITFLC